MTPRNYINPSRRNPEGLFVTRHDWMRSAACRGVGTESFFEGRADKALQYCWRCPVTQDCADYAHHNGEQGIWGGTTDAQRARGIRYMPQLVEPAEDSVFMSARIRELHEQGVAWRQITKLTGVHPRNIARVLAKRAAS